MPMPANPYMASAAVADLGLGAELVDQVGEETDEMRRKRLLELQQRKLYGSNTGAPALGGAVTSLFGGGVGGYG